MDERDIFAIIKKIVQLEALSIEDNHPEIEKISFDLATDMFKNKVYFKMEFNDLSNFIEDFDIRRKDSHYRKSQTNKILALLSSGCKDTIIT
jgi:hypothetical protein